MLSVGMFALAGPQRLGADPLRLSGNSLTAGRVVGGVAVGLAIVSVLWAVSAASEASRRERRAALLERRLTRH